MSTIELTRQADGKFKLAGTATVETVGQMRDEITAALVEGPAESSQIDLSEFESTGAAGVALLIATLRDCRVNDRKLEFTNPTQHFAAIADACGVRDILGFSR